MLAQQASLSLAVARRPPLLYVIIGASRARVPITSRSTAAHSAPIDDRRLPFRITLQGKPRGHRIGLVGSGRDQQMDDVIEKSAMRKIYLRLLPFAILSYFLAYIGARQEINAQFGG